MQKKDNKHVVLWHFIPIQKDQPCRSYQLVVPVGENHEAMWKTSGWFPPKPLPLSVTPGVATRSLPRKPWPGNGLGSPNAFRKVDVFKTGMEEKTWSGFNQNHDMMPFDLIFRNF